MEEIVTILSTREWAIAIWGTGFFVWMLTQREIRKSLWNVIKILLGKNLRHFFLIIALYVAGITMIFYQLPFWNNIYLKDIILWLIFSGISYCVNSIIILHVPANELQDIIKKMANALRAHGIIYTSFKYGTFEGERNGRYFTDMTEETFAKLIQDMDELEIEEQWITSDVRPGRGEEKWLNLILRKE